MVYRAGFVIAWGMLVISFVLPIGAAAEISDGERLNRLTLQLGSSEFAEREAAKRELEAAGPPALPVLRRAALTDDPEIRRRADALVQQIEKRVEAAKLLEPRTVRLVYRDMALREAVADFSAKTGIHCQVGHEAQRGSPTSAVLNRMITLDTGDVSPWEAFHQFCRAAGLVEQHLIPQKQASARNTARPEADGVWIARRQIVAASGQSPVSPSRSILVDGQAPNLPTVIAGPLRIRALPPHVRSSAFHTEDAEAPFSLEVTGDSNLTWLHFGNLRIDKAVDEHGHALTPIFGVPAFARAAQTLEELVWIDSAGSANNVTAPPHQNIPVRIKLGQKPSPRLRELRGSISAQVQTAPEALLTVEKLLEAAGKTIHGVDGCSMEFRDVVCNDNGELTIRATVRVPVQPNRWNPDFRAGRVRVVRGKAATKTSGNGTTNPYIVDADGKPHFAQVDTNTTVTPDANIHDVKMSCKISRSGAETAKLVYSGPRTLVIEVPFEFKDVPLR